MLIQGTVEPRSAPSSVSVTMLAVHALVSTQAAHDLF